MAQQIYDDNKYTGVRLPTEVKPVNYELCLKPNFQELTFEGNIKIGYECSCPQDAIVLNSNELIISSGHLLNSNSEKLNNLKNVTYSKATETAILEFDDAIEAKGILFLAFKGTLSDTLAGFYRTSFKIDGCDVFAATTHFEPTDARRCFPCWDEPAIRATFSIKLVFDQFMEVNGKQYERVALSNMPETSRTSIGDQIEVSFAKTPSMSTYLLAFIVGPFEFIEGTDSRRPVRIYTTPGKKEQGRYALDVACKSLPYYEDYFNVPYPLPKMDLIAIPDFPIGAMENWGLVTYRETRLLVDPQNTATYSKQYVALVVAHELSHQWFGNLVTINWWTHLWLKEGFATFMEYLCVDYIFPQYDIWSQFVTDDYGRALELDSFHNSHPIEVPVGHPNQIREIFDGISYSKGASVIRMLYHYIGDDCFRAGMKDYLTKFAYKSAITEDLWDCLEAASSKPVRELMSGWTGQKGYPRIDVFKCNEDIVMWQCQFTADGELLEDEAKISWMIPISAITGKNPTQEIDLGVLDCGPGGSVSKFFPFREVGHDTWVKLNPGTVGLYRTMYVGELMEKLLVAIENQSLPSMDRLGLQNDLYALCRAGKVETIELLKLLRAFKHETNYTVWRSIDNCISQLDNIFSSTDYKDKFDAFVRELYSEIFKRLTWSATASNEAHTDNMTRSLVINRLIASNDPNVTGKALTLYKMHLDKTEVVPADLRGPVYRAVATSGDDPSFESLFAIFREEELHEEKNRIARSLGFATDSERLRKALEFVLSNEVRNQDKVSVLEVVGRSNRSAAWKFLKDNKDFLRSTYKGGNLIRTLVKVCTQNFATEERAQEVANFFKENDFPGVERTLQQSIENILLNAKWLARIDNKVKEFLG